MWPNSQFPAELVTFTEKILNEKLHFLCSGITFFVVEEVPTPIPTKPPPVEAKAYVPRQIYGGLYVCL